MIWGCPIPRTAQDDGVFLSSIGNAFVSILCQHDLAVCPPLVPAFGASMLVYCEEQLLPGLPSPSIQPLPIRVEFPYQFQHVHPHILSSIHSCREVPGCFQNPPDPKLSNISLTHSKLRSFTPQFSKPQSQLANSNVIFIMAFQFQSDSSVDKFLH